MKAKILALLRERGDYVSGQEICQAFGVTRTAIWKAINLLKKEGYEIEAVRNRGYLLLGDKDIYGKNGLLSRIHTKWAGQNIKFFECLGSTNIQAKQEAEEGAAHGTLIVADMQTAGRGRRGKEWDSPGGTNIYATLILKPDFAPDKASMLTLVMAHSTARAIRKETGLEAGIKWPNDIVVNKKKVCGILTEMSAELDYIHHVVIGVGINVGKQTFPTELLYKAACLEEECGHALSRSAIITSMMEYFEEDYENFLRFGNLKGLLPSYNKMLVNRDAMVKVLDPKEAFEGRAEGINENGELMVEKEDGSLVHVYAGEVSVRGIYGYV